MQYDIYHMQIMEGDLAPTIEKNLKLIPHMQLADTPGRHEPGTGEINYTFLLDFIDKIGYQGWIGCEYKPAGKTEDGLGWTLVCAIIGFEDARSISPGSVPQGASSRESEDRWTQFIGCRALKPERLYGCTPH